jgi:hypothetical protein
MSWKLGEIPSKRLAKEVYMRCAGACMQHAAKPYRCKYKVQ